MSVNFSSIIKRPIMSSNSSMTDTISHSNGQNYYFGQQEMHTKEEIIKNTLSILRDPEKKAKIWFDSGMNAEYVRRFGPKLPNNWIEFLRDSDGQIDVEVQNYSNVTKTFIALPVPKKRISKVSTNGSPNTVNAVQFTTDESNNTVIKKDSMLTNVMRSENNSINMFKAEQNMKNETKRETIAQNVAKPESMVTNDTKNFLNEWKSDNSDKRMPEVREPKLSPSDSFGTEYYNMKNETMNALNGDSSVDDVILNGKPIPAADLPEIKPNPMRSEDYWDIVVVQAATPSNFIVVPFTNAATDSDFNLLKTKMYEFYENEDNGTPLAENLIIKGQYYAGKFRSIWHRLEVLQIISKNPFQVMCSLVDYGEIQLFELKDLQPLFSQFRQLARQAIRASLATAQPLGSDWDVMAGVEFRKMVENKPFVATVFDVFVVDNNPVLSLSLCDTSGTTDVYIEKKLVERGLAQFRVVQM